MIGRIFLRLTEMVVVERDYRSFLSSADKPFNER